MVQTRHTTYFVSSSLPNVKGYNPIFSVTLKIEETGEREEREREKDQ